MTYPHRLVVSRPASGSPGGSHDDDGAWVPGDPTQVMTTVYEGLADVQDKGVVIERDQAGQPTRLGDAVVFLADERNIGLIKVGDHAVITWDDGTQATATVERVVRLDGSLMLRRL